MIIRGTSPAPFTLPQLDQAIMDLAQIASKECTLHRILRTIIAQPLKPQHQHSATGLAKAQRPR